MQLNPNPLSQNPPTPSSAERKRRYIYMRTEPPFSFSIPIPNPPRSRPLLSRVRMKYRYVKQESKMIPPPDIPSLSNSQRVNLASIIRFPPILCTFAINSPLSSSAWTSSPPPMLFPLMRTLGTVRRPVLFSSSSCNRRPSGCSSSSTTKGGGVMVYLERRMNLAFLECGQ